MAARFPSHLALIAAIFLIGCQTADTNVGLTTNQGPRVKEEISAPDAVR